MQTLSVTNARKNLGAWVKKAIEGEDVGILVGDHVVALRPVEVVSKDYAFSEYGLTPAEMKKASVKLHEKANQAIRSGKAKKFNGNIEDALR